MSIKEKYQTIMGNYNRSIQSNGEVTLPKEWREEQGVGQGDTVAIREKDDGTLEIVPPPK